MDERRNRIAESNGKCATPVSQGNAAPAKASCYICTSGEHSPSASCRGAEKGEETGKAVFSVHRQLSESFPAVNLSTSGWASSV